MTVIEGITCQSLYSDQTTRRILVPVQHADRRILSRKGSPDAGARREAWPGGGDRSTVSRADWTVVCCRRHWARLRASQKKGFSGIAVAAATPVPGGSSAK